MLQYAVGNQQFHSVLGYRYKILESPASQDNQIWMLAQIPMTLVPTLTLAVIPRPTHVRIWSSSLTPTQQLRTRTQSISCAKGEAKRTLLHFPYPTGVTLPIQ